MTQTFTMEESFLNWWVCIQSVNRLNPKQTPEIAQMKRAPKGIYIPLLALRKARGEWMRHKHLLQTHLKLGEKFASSCAFSKPWDQRFAFPSHHPSLTQCLSFATDLGSRTATCSVLRAFFSHWGNSSTESSSWALWGVPNFISSPSTPASHHGKLK